MPQGKAHFGSRDLTPLINPSDDKGVRVYNGLEQRHDDRRAAVDRRNEARFEVTKQERRQALGRRCDDARSDLW